MSEARKVRPKASEHAFCLVSHQKNLLLDLLNYKKKFENENYDGVCPVYKLSPESSKEKIISSFENIEEFRFPNTLKRLTCDGHGIFLSDEPLDLAFGQIPLTPTMFGQLLISRGLPKDRPIQIDIIGCQIGLIRSIKDKKDSKADINDSYLYQLARYLYDKGYHLVQINGFTSFISNFNLVSLEVKSTKFLNFLLKIDVVGLTYESQLEFNKCKADDHLLPTYDNKLNLAENLYQEILKFQKDLEREIPKNKEFQEDQKEKANEIALEIEYDEIFFSMYKSIKKQFELYKKQISENLSLDDKIKIIKELEILLSKLEDCCNYARNQYEAREISLLHNFQKKIYSVSSNILDSLENPVFQITPKSLKALENLTPGRHAAVRLLSRRLNKLLLNKRKNQIQISILTPIILELMHPHLPLSSFLKILQQDRNNTKLGNKICDEIGKIIEIIETEFNVAGTASIHKGLGLDPVKLKLAASVDVQQSGNMSLSDEKKKEIIEDHKEAETANNNPVADTVVGTVATSVINTDVDVTEEDSSKNKEKHKRDQPRI